MRDPYSTMMGGQTTAATNQAREGLKRVRDQAAATGARTAECHAHVHCGRVRSLRGGNIWKYIATTIGTKTMVL